MGTKRSNRKAEPALSGEQLDELISRVKNGEVDAFQRVYELYGRKIVNYIYRMTGSRAEAEDLTQDTFVLAYKKIQSLKENRKFQSWLYRIAQNNVYQKYRGKRPHFESIDQEEGPGLGEVQNLPSSTKSPEERVLSEELQQVVHSVINELPEKYKEVFVLSALHKLSYQEISDIVGRSLASVKSDIHRARVTVRDKIKKYLGDNYGMSSLL